MDRPFAAYDGDEPYIFVSYAHADSALVYPEIAWLHQQGFRIWYDEGISPGSEWHTELAESIEGCSLFLYFVTPRSALSEHCQREVHYAMEHRKPLLAVHLEPAELPSGLRFSLSATQAILRHELNETEYREKLLKGVSVYLEQGVTERTSSPPAKKKPRAGLMAALVLAGVVFTAVLWLYVLDDDVSELSSPDSLSKETVAKQNVAIRSNWVAVLPFRNASGATAGGTDQLAEGLTGELIGALSGLGQFSVVSHGAVRGYSDSNRHTGEIATALGVRYLLEGSVQASGTQTQVAVMLVDGVEGNTVWEWRRRYQDRGLLEIQDDVAQTISRALEVKLVQLESARVRNLPADEMRAWEYYALAMDAWEDFNHVSLASGIEAHRQALELDPDFVASVGQLSVLIKMQLFTGGNTQRENAREEACQLADRAIALGQDSPFALFSGVSVLADLCGEAEKAIQISRRMLPVHPNSGYNVTLLGVALFFAGQHDEAIQVLDQAERDYPDNAYVFRYSPLYRSYIYTDLRQWEEVVKVTRTALNLNPSSVFMVPYLANALGALGRREEAAVYWLQLLERFPDFTVAQFEWFVKQGVVTDERVERFVEGLKQLGLDNS